MEAACPLLRFVNYDEPKTKREIYKSHFKAKIKRFSSDKVIFNEKRPIFVNFRSFFVVRQFVGINIAILDNEFYFLAFRYFKKCHFHSKIDLFLV